MATGDLDTEVTILEHSRSRRYVNVHIHPAAPQRWARPAPRSALSCVRGVGRRPLWADDADVGVQRALAVQVGKG